MCIYIKTTSCTALHGPQAHCFLRVCLYRLLQNELMYDLGSPFPFWTTVSSFSFFDLSCCLSLSRIANTLLAKNVWFRCHPRKQAGWMDG
ncbi:rCG63651 [Rattus norvegicus]|uniref:RCG63651 n=1 Tax=Rattus norvegicus TaxID=10116 RepID=A6J1N1_RAT|nr:rCG63651 [Rattus norvegicus]